MQRKIEKILNKWGLLGPGSIEKAIVATEVAAAEIATLFERKVIWEGESEVLESQEDKEAVIYIGSSSSHEVDAFALWIYGRPANLKDGQRVRVVVEEIDDKKPTD